MSKADTLNTLCEASKINSSVLRGYLGNSEFLVWVLKCYEIKICRMIDLRLDSQIHDKWALTLIKFCKNQKMTVKVINCFM